MLTRNLLAATALAALGAGAASAQTVTATTKTDLNLRSGPGVQYGVTDYAPRDAEVSVLGCYAEADWCLVEHEGGEGWASQVYLDGLVDRDVVATVTAENIPAPEGTRDFSGVVVAPETADLDATEIAEATIAYITQNPVEPVWLDGEIVIGAGLPETVTLYDLPEADYAYVNVNAQPVVVDPANRQVVYILR